VFTNATVLRPKTEYLRGWANFQAGRETNAFQVFTNFVARYPRHECTPLAHWWVADYFFRTGKLREAEENFQLLYQSTNWPNLEFPYQARMMAGRTAVRREVWKDAIDYFTTLTGDTNCPADIWADAMFAYGNVLMMRDSTNKLSDYAWAANIFNSIYTRFPNQPTAVLALGEKAGCLLQWAQTDPQFDATGHEFRRVITNQLANPTARAIARVGLATVFENQAKTKQGAEQAALFRQALDSYLDVFFYTKDLRLGEQPDLFWMQKAGLEAARLTETLQDWDKAIRIYEYLRQLVPALRPSLDRKLARANENLLKTKI
jgi:tetratricopeptide (TPR) repeat protein